MLGELRIEKGLGRPGRGGGRRGEAGKDTASHGHWRTAYGPRRGEEALARQRQVSPTGDSGSRLGDGFVEDGRWLMVGGEAGIGSFVGIEEETPRVCLGAHVSTSI